jgi:hypothetical protein
VRVYIHICILTYKHTHTHTNRFTLKEGTVKKHPYTPEQSDKWTRDSRLHRENMMTKRAIETGEIMVIVEVVALSGILRSARGDFNKRFDGETLEFPLQLAAERPTQVDKRFEERSAASANDEFPLGTEVLVLQKPLTGTLARVVAHVNERLVEVEMELTPRVRPEQDFFGQRLIISKEPESWMMQQQLAMMLRVPPFIVSKITSSLRVRGGMDVGLNIKFEKKGFSMVGYARKDRETNQWEFSSDALQLLSEYKKLFPLIFANLGKCSDSREGVDPKELLPGVGDTAQYLQDVQDFLRKHPYARLPLMPLSGQVCMWTLMCVYVYMYHVRVCMYLCLYTYIIHIRIYVYNIYIYIYTHIHTVQALP